MNVVVVMGVKDASKPTSRLWVEPSPTPRGAHGRAIDRWP